MRLGCEDRALATGLAAFLALADEDDAPADLVEPWACVVKGASARLAAADTTTAVNTRETAWEDGKAQIRKKEQKQDIGIKTANP